MTVEHDLLVGGTFALLNNVDDQRIHALGVELSLGDSLNVKLIDIIIDTFHGLLN